MLAFGGRWVVHRVFEATAGSMSTASEMFLETLGLTAIFAFFTWRLLASVSSRRAAVLVTASRPSAPRTVRPIVFEERARGRHLSLVPAPATD